MGKEKCVYCKGTGFVGTGKFCVCVSKKFDDALNDAFGNVFGDVFGDVFKKDNISKKRKEKK